MQLPLLTPANEAVSHDDMIRVGVAAMAKKAESSPMRELLERLRSMFVFNIIVFEQDTLLNVNIEQWPICHCLIAFHSNGFPLDKAIAYAELRKPFLLNDLKKQKLLFDRRLVYTLLKDTDVPVPQHVFATRDHFGGATTSCVDEYDEYVVVDGVRINKPFIEKPVSGDNHNVNLYYSSRQGGGCRRLFRKVKNRSSDVISANSVRREGSYVYEHFIPTARDVKVYTVGPDFSYAESRKSPTVDGVVERNRFGKERREVENLSIQEKDMVSRVCSAFSQTVCGLDMLRNGPNSFVIDVNGWSFVKGSAYYYDQCAAILRSLMLASEVCAPLVSERCRRTEEQLRHANQPTRFVDAERGDVLLGVIAIYRHADRTCKQKIKFSCSHDAVLALVAQATPNQKEITFKSNESLERLQRALRLVLDDSLIHIHDKTHVNISSVIAIIGSTHVGIKVQLKCTFDTNTSCEQARVVSVRIICKWGGEITSAGKQQSLLAGSNFGKSVLTLSDDVAHQRSLFLNNMKVVSSDEKRVLQSAQEFVSGLLSTCGQPQPSEISFLADSSAQKLVNSTCDAKQLIDEAKQIIQHVLKSDNSIESLRANFDDNSMNGVSKGVLNCLIEIDNTNERLMKMLHYMQLVVAYLDDSALDVFDWYGDESRVLVLARWHKLVADLYVDETRLWDATKIPNIYDSAKYDTLHNSQVSSQLCDVWTSVLHISKLLADFVVPQEYGITSAHKLAIAELIVRPLVNDIISCCESVSDENSTAKSRCILYFSSESHLHALRNLLVWHGLAANDIVAARLDTMELAYFSHALIRVYEDMNVPQNHLLRRYVSLEFSPGADENPKVAQQHHLQSLSPPLPVHGRIPISSFLEALQPHHTKIHST